MKTFYSDLSSYDEAVAALDRIWDRTSSGIQRIEAAGQAFQPGASVAGRLAGNQKELLSILADFKAAVGPTGGQAAWTAARSKYTAWYENAQPVLRTAMTDMQALGVTCA